MMNATIRRSYLEEYKKNHVINQLKKYGITDVDGVPLENLEYEHLKRQLALARYRAVDITADANAWF